MRTMQENGEQFVILPMVEYKKIIAKPILSDEDYDEMLGEIVSSQQEEGFPFNLFERIDGGENGVKLLREHRNISASNLADMAGLSRAYISQIESGERKGTAKTLQKIAVALNVDVDMLV